MQRSERQPRDCHCTDVYAALALHSDGYVDCSCLSKSFLQPKRASIRFLTTTARTDVRGRRTGTSLTREASYVLQASRIIVLVKNSNEYSRTDVQSHFLEIMYAKPKRGKTAQGEWKDIVNVKDYTQTLRMEKCL